MEFIDGNSMGMGSMGQRHHVIFRYYSGLRGIEVDQELDGELMYPKEIPDFIADVMEQIEIAIDRVAYKKHGVLEGDTELAEATRSIALVQYPDQVEIMLNIEAKIDDGTVDGTYESQTIWVKIPWPKRGG